MVKCWKWAKDNFYIERVVRSEKEEVKLLIICSRLVYISWILKLLVIFVKTNRVMQNYRQKTIKSIGVSNDMR